MPNNSLRLRQMGHRKRPPSQPIPLHSPPTRPLPNSRMRRHRPRRRLRHPRLQTRRRLGHRSHHKLPHKSRYAGQHDVLYSYGAEQCEQRRLRSGECGPVDIFGDDGGVGAGGAESEAWELSQSGSRDEAEVCGCFEACAGDRT